MLKNDVMITVIKRCRGEKKRQKKNRSIQKKIPNSEIAECLEYNVKSKIGNIFLNEKILKEYSVKVYEIDPQFYEYYKKKNTS